MNDMDRKLKVMHMVWSMGDGGAQRVILNYLRDFKEDPDLDMQLYVYNNAEDSFCNREIREHGFNVTYLNNPQSKLNLPLIKRLFNPAVAQKNWEQAIRAYQPDIVHVHISALLGVTLKPIVNTGVPVRFDTLHSDPRRYKGKALQTNKTAFGKEHFIPLCLTKEQSAIARQRYGFDHCEILPNGIDFAALRNRKTEKAAARAKLNLPENAFLVLGVGRLDPIKNFSFLIDAFFCLYSQNPSAVLALAGRGSQLDTLRKKAAELSLGDKVYFLGNQDDMAMVYSAADVLGVTSISESFSLTVLEAQALGVRCVISDGVPDESIITDRVKKMPPFASPEEWGNALAERDFIDRKVCDEKDYEVHAISARLKQIYLHYWKEYCDGK